MPKHENRDQFPHAFVARNPFAWPGGYAVFLIMDNGETLCHACVRAEYRSIARENRWQHGTGWKPMGWDHAGNCEDRETCAHCGATIFDPEA